MGRMRKPEPYVQGELDGLCGPYAVVNVAHYLCGPLSEKRAISLLLQLLNLLRETLDPIDRLEEGTGRLEMRRLVQCVCNAFPLSSALPYLRRTQNSSDEVWAEIEHFLNDKRGLVLIGFKREDWGHWTIIRALTAKSILLFDSDGMVRISRRESGFDGSGKRYIFHLATAHFVCREEQAQTDGRTV